MLYTFFDWLEGQPYRWPIANVILVTLILALVDSPELMSFIGALGLGLLALFGAHAARKAMRLDRSRRHPFELLLLWLPGAFAFALASGGLWLATTGHMPVLGLVIFAGHAALVTRIACDQEFGKTVLPEPAFTEMEAS